MGHLVPLRPGSRLEVRYAAKLTPQCLLDVCILAFLYSYFHTNDFKPGHDSTNLFQSAMSTELLDPKEADRNDPLSWTRDEFEFPTRIDSGADGRDLPVIGLKVLLEDGQILM